MKEDVSSQRAIGAEMQLDDQEYDITLRPTRFDDFVGQAKLCSNLQVFVKAAKARQQPLDHVLFCGPPGLGKTTLSNLLASELDVNLISASGPAIEHKGQLATLLTKLEPRDVLFIDEIHRLSPVIEENLYTAIEDFRIDIVQGDGPYASTLQLRLQPFTLVGATTRTGLLTSPLLSRFGYIARMDYYNAEDLAHIVKRSARLLHMDIEPAAAEEIAQRARGTPRVANRLLRRARDFAEVLGNGKVELASTQDALERLDVDTAGLEEMDRRLLRIIIEHYKGGPVGIETLAASLSESRDTLEDVYEPFLIQNGLLARTARGRMATELAYKHLNIPFTERTQESLF